MFTTRPVTAAARSRSVWRERKAGICRISATSAAPPPRPRPGKESPGGGFRLVEGSFKDNGVPGRGGGATGPPRQVDSVLLAFYDTGTRNESKRAAAADPDIAKLNRVHEPIIPAA